MPLTNSMLRTAQLAEPNARPVRALVRERSYSEETITPEISLTVSAVLAAFTILTEDLSSLPLLLYERQGRNKFRAYGSPYYRLMHDQPNPEHTSMIFREFIIGHLLAWGNFFGQLITDRRGDVVEVWPLRPDKMSVKRLDGERVYLYTLPDGKPRAFLSDEILHIPAFGFDGLIGYSRIALARNAIGLAISTEKFGSKLFANNAQPGHMYKHPGKLSDPAFKHLQDSLDERKGVDKSHMPIILEEGLSIEKLGIDPDDAQFLETRKFQVGEVARIFRVPPHMIGDVDRSTSWGSGIDAQEQGYVNHTLRPWAKRTEEHLNLRILPEAERAAKYYEHLMDGLLRGDIATRYAAYVSAITNGFMSRNEARERENMNPRRGLDAILMPLNMTTVNTGAELEQGTAAQQALDPLWRDAIARVLKREVNDLGGASRRLQVKGQLAEFAQWLDQFYHVDHPAFIRKQFAPILAAQARLFGLDMGAALDVFINEFLDERLALVASMSADAIADGMETYTARAMQEFLTFISDIVELHQAATVESESEDLEAEYE